MSQPTAGLTSICLQKVINVHPACLESSSVDVGSLGRNYRYIIVATQIPQDVDWRQSDTLSANSCLAGDRTSAASRSMSSKQFGLNRVKTRPGFINCKLKSPTFSSFTVVHSIGYINPCRPFVNTVTSSAGLVETFQQPTRSADDVTVLTKGLQGLTYPIKWYDGEGWK